MAMMESAEVGRSCETARDLHTEFNPHGISSDVEQIGY